MAENRIRPGKGRTGPVRAAATAAAACFFLGCGGVRALAAREALPPLKPLRTAASPVIDGLLDDAVWRQAPSESGFKTWNPDFGKDMRQKTVVYYAYDRENLYFAFQCFDSEPGRIKASVTSRDNITNDDFVCLNLDSFNDQQALYALYVNPLGIQADSRFEANTEDFSVDVVWYSAGRIDDQGYTVEVRVPFKSIRYSSREPVTMGIIFERRVSRLSEAGTYPPLDPAQGPNFLTQTRSLVFDNIAHYTLLEMLPSVISSGGSLFDQGALRARQLRSELSLTGKYGLTSQLIFDATVYPDFSQVESDAGQVDFNLRYSLYYPEKRPFFLEGQEKFYVAASVTGDPLSSAVNTRTIVDPYLGFKLNGKLGDRDALAAIYALDELPAGSARDYAQFAIVRYKHGLKDDSYLGGFFTGRFEGSRRNAVLGLDGQLRLTPASFFAYHLFGSTTRLDGSTPAADGHALGLQYYYQTRNLVANVTLHDLSPDFQTEAGYLTRTGLTRFRGGIMPLIYPVSDLFLRLDPVLHLTLIRDKLSGLYETDDTLDLRLILPRSTTFLVGGRYGTEIFLGRKFNRSGFRLKVSSQLTKQLSISGTLVSGGKIRYVDDPYQGRGSDALLEVIYIPSEKLHFDLNLSYSDFTRSADERKEYDYSIVRGLATYQFNKYLFVRAIAEYNSFYRRLTTDFLVSFTYIPGTVLFLGYGSLYERLAWREDELAPSDRFLETQRSFFFKASYLWRL
jgi:hypothetical protein